MADVHVEMLNEPGYLRKNRGLLEGIHKSGLVDCVVDGPSLWFDDADHRVAVAGTFCCSLLVIAFAATRRQDDKDH